MTSLSQLTRSPCVACQTDQLIVAGQCSECRTVQPYAVGVKPVRVVNPWKKTEKVPLTQEQREAVNQRQRDRRARLRGEQRQQIPPREMEAVTLAAQGLRNVDIARAMGLDPASVHDALTKAQNRLGLSCRAQLLRWARAPAAQVVA
jgi:DNA-binding CsgD family transcriptional regulator